MRSSLVSTRLSTNIQKKGWGLPGRGLAYCRMRWNWYRYHAGVGGNQVGLGSAWRDLGRKGGALVGAGPPAPRSLEGTGGPGTRQRRCRCGRLGDAPQGHTALRTGWEGHQAALE